MSTEIEFGYNSPLEDMDLATSLCLLDYNGQYITVPYEIWHNHGYKILNWFDLIYDGQVKFLKQKHNEPATIVLPRPIEEKINVEEFLVWIKLSTA